MMPPDGPPEGLDRCPVEATLSVISGKWKPLIIYHLLSGTLRFSELQRRLPGVTRRMLTQHLRELEADEIVHREVYKQVPPRVEYSLTEVGRQLAPVFDHMLQWGLGYLQGDQATASEG